jgi:hypothetical protein
MSFRIIELVAGSCERGDNLLCSIKGGKYHDYKLQKRDFLLRIRKGLGSNLGPETGYPD